MFQSIKQICSDGSCRLEKSVDLFRVRIDVDVVDAGAGRQAGHGRHGPDEREEEARTDGSSDVTDGQGEPRGRALDGGVGGEGVLGLGHADGKVVEALTRVAVDGSSGV